MLTERQIGNRRRAAASEALLHYTASSVSGNPSLAEHWMNEASRIMSQPLTMDADLRVRTPYDAAIERENER